MSKPKYKLLGKNAYDVLGITPDTLQGEAKRQYHTLARKYHPDRNPGDENVIKEAADRFKEVQEAWDEIADTLPKSEIPFPDIDPNDPDFEEKIAGYMLAVDAATPKASAKAKKSAAPSSNGVWTTVASETASGTGMTVAGSSPLKDWRHQTIRRWKSGVGLERINADEAADLIYGRPNAFDALKIVQQLDPTLCLYDAILARAQGASRKPSSSKKSSSKKSSSHALVIIGADDVDRDACKDALRNPLASVEMAVENIYLIAPQIELESASVTQQKLAFDLTWLREAILALAEKTAKRASGIGGGGTRITRG
jgi:curved DNA-binding protein CbpA